MITYFVVQAFDRTRMGFLAPDVPIQATDEQHARRLADRLAYEKPGVIAFKRTGNPSTGEYDDAVVIAAFGEIPQVDGEFSIAC